jgi:putative flippase GtrA
LVNALRRIIDGWHHLIRELAKFGIIGIVNTVLDLVVFNALLPMGFLKAKCISVLISATSSYFMNRHWTFRHRARSGIRREYVLFFVFNAAGLAIALAALALTKYGLGHESRLAANLANVAGLVLGTIFRFWSYRKWVFLHPEDALYATTVDAVAPASTVTTVDANSAKSGSQLAVDQEPADHSPAD